MSEVTSPRLGTENSNQRLPTQLLKVQTFIRTVRKSTDLAHKVDWPLLTEREHHAKVMDICQLLIKDMLTFLSNSFGYSNPETVIEDFIKSYYPDLNIYNENSKPGVSSQAVKARNSTFTIQESEFKAESVETFGELQQYEHS